jgi:O-Antigen ligase
LNFFILIAACLFIYALIYKPEIIAVLFFTITLADINFDLGPLNMRAITGIALFLRILVPDKTNNYPSFFSTSGVYILFFLFYAFLVTMNYDLLNFNFIKITGTTVISVYCGYHFFFKKNDYTYLKLSIILAGLICFSDLIYTYAVVGKFPVQRIYMQLLKIPVQTDDEGDFIEVINHGFYGLICGLCFVFLLNEFIYKRSSKLNLFIMPLMLLGVLMSTSRSALLGLIGISIYLIAKELKSSNQSKKAARRILIGLGVAVLSLFLFLSLKDVFNLNSQFMDEITLRLIDEPVAVFYKHMGLNYDANSLNAMNWREEASSNAFEAFLNLNTIEQIFGIGFWGFVIRNLGRNNLPPHNAILLMLIENGVLGLFFYATLVFSIIRKSLKTQENISPVATALIFILFFCLGNNGELTTSNTFLIVITIIAENKYFSLNPVPKMKLYHV